MVIIHPLSDLSPEYPHSTWKYTIKNIKPNIIIRLRSNLAFYIIIEKFPTLYGIFDLNKYLLFNKYMWYRIKELKNNVNSNNYRNEELINAKNSNEIL